MMKVRDQSLDIFKGLLVFGMIYDHVLVFFGNSNISSLERYIILFINIITFSGFMFSFGYAYQIAYFCKDIKDVYIKIIISSAKPLIAFYISAVFFRIFVSDSNLNLGDILNIFILSDIPLFSEFLASFFVVALLTLIFFKTFQDICNNKKIFVISLIIPLILTFIPYEKITINQIGLLIGSTRFYVFPVLQYMPYFLLGIFFSKNDIRFNLKIFMGSLVSTSIFIFYLIRTGEVPTRFPPSIYWILSSTLFLYLYYMISKILSSTKISTGIIQLFGKNVLYYLLISNIILFILYKKYNTVDLNALEGLGVTILIVSIISYLLWISTKMEKKLVDY